MSERAGPTRVDESRLLERLRAGDASAWRGVLAQHQDRLYGVCLRMVRDRDVAADLTQDAMLRVVRGIARFDAQSQLGTWMVRIAMNVCLSHLRGAKLRAHQSLDAVPVGSADDRGSRRERLADRELSAPHRVESTERTSMLAAALDRLEPEPRAILILRDVQGLDYAQIAQALGVPVGTVKSRLFRAREQLRQSLENAGH